MHRIALLIGLFVLLAGALTASTASGTVTPAIPCQIHYCPPNDASQCKDSATGWQFFFGLGFRNQGDCVSYVQTQGRNGPAGP